MLEEGEAQLTQQADTVGQRRGRALLGWSGRPGDADTQRGDGVAGPSTAVSAPPSDEGNHDDHIEDGGVGVMSDEDGAVAAGDLPAGADTASDLEACVKKLIATTGAKVESIKMEHNAAIASLGNKIQRQMKQIPEQMHACRRMPTKVANTPRACALQ